MSASGKTRRTSDYPATRPAPGTSWASGSRRETRIERRDETTTNDAPEWQSTFPRRSSKSTWRGFDKDDDTPARTRIDFAAPSVAPSDSVSRVRSHQPRGRQYEVITKRETKVTRRPDSSSSSDDDNTTERSDGAPLTENNLESFSRRASRSRVIESRTAKSPRRPSRRESRAVSEDFEEDDRVTKQTSRRRETITVAEIERSKSVRESDMHTTRSRRARTNAQEYESKSSNTQVIAAGAAAGAAGGVAAQTTAQRAPTRASSNTRGPQTQVTSRRDSKVAGAEDATSTRVVETTKTVQAEDIASSRLSRPQPPSDPWAQGSDTSPTSATSATPPAPCEWERRVYIREYIRPSDGKLIEDRETIWRKLSPPSPPRIAGSVRA